MQRDISELYKTITDLGNRDDLRFIFVGDPHLTSATPVSRKDDYPTSVLNKMSQVRDQAIEVGADFVVLSGDVFHTKRQPDSFMVDLTLLLSSFTVPVYTIVGNHDILYTNIDTLKRTPLGVLISSGAVRWLDTITLTIEDSTVSLQGMDYMLDPVVPQVKKVSDFNILFAHQFAPGGNKFDTINKETFTYEDMANSLFNMFCMGHDHTPYGLASVGAKVVVRPGSLTRGTKSAVNRARGVDVAIIDIFKEEGTLHYDHNLFSLDILSPEVVFLDTEIKRSDVKKQISSFVKAMKEHQEVDSHTEVYAIIQRLCMGDEELLVYVKQQLLDHVGYSF